MKRYLFLLLFLLTTVSNSQWFVQNPVGLGESYNACFFIDSLTGWVCGNNGVIIYTWDGGNSWIHQKSNVTYNLSNIHFYSKNSGWAVGGGGTIIHTTNGGVIWVSRNNPGNYLTVTAINDSSCWVTGTGSLIFYTTDHGYNWTQKNFYPNYAINGTSFSNMMEGWVAAYKYISPLSSGLVCKTVNGGGNWSIQSSSNSMSRGIFFINQKFGWAVGDPGANIKTINGSTWTPMVDLQSKYLDKIYFADSVNGFAKALHGEALYRTTDGGNSWTTCQTFPNTIVGLCYISKSIGWIVGANGMIMKTTNGGINWFSQSGSITNTEFFTIYFIDQNNGWAAGRLGILVHTNNGGAKWNRLPNPITYSIKSLFFLNKNIGWAACDYHILKTTNGGVDWTTQLFEGYERIYTSIHFTDSLNGYCTSEKNSKNDGMLYKTVDGGVTWSIRFIDNSDGFKSIHFTDDINAYIVGRHGKIYRTTNAWGSWLQQNSSVTTTLNSVSFSNSDHGIVVGDSSVILRTTNGGDMWNLVRLDLITNLYSVSVVDSANSWLVCSNGKVYKTMDGGEGWSQVYSPNTQNNGLDAVLFLDNHTGWISGMNGLIMRYGFMTDSDENNEFIEIPGLFDLHQNYPNPFNSVTKIRYSLKEGGRVSIKVYNLLGREITNLVDEIKSPGIFEVTFEGNDFPSGIYFYRMRINGNMSTKKALLLK